MGILSTAEDITQTMNLEKQLLQSQKMEAIGTWLVESLMISIIY